MKYTVIFRFNIIINTILDQQHVEENLIITIKTAHILTLIWEGKMGVLYGRVR